MNKFQTTMTRLEKPWMKFVMGLFTRNRQHLSEDAPMKKIIYALLIFLFSFNTVPFAYEHFSINLAHPAERDRDRFLYALEHGWYTEAEIAGALEYVSITTAVGNRTPFYRSSPQYIEYPLNYNKLNLVWWEDGSPLKALAYFIDASTQS